MVRQSFDEADKALTITWAHVRKAGFSCRQGGPARVRKFMTRYKIDWDKFSRGELTVGDVAHVKNAIVWRVVAEAINGRR